MRQLRWSKEKRFEGWTRSDCGWLVPNPSLDFENRTKEQLRDKAQKDFDSHDCAKYPRKPKSSDFKRRGER